MSRYSSSRGTMAAVVLADGKRRGTSPQVMIFHFMVGTAEGDDHLLQSSGDDHRHLIQLMKVMNYFSLGIQQFFPRK